MRYQVLGRTGARVSELALGTMTFGEDWGWGASKEESAKVLDLYADAGGNFIDTANVYTNGSSELILGELLKGRRDRFLLATKYTNQTDPDDANSAGNSRKNLVTSLEASLRRLNSDHIDVYWVHARDVLTPIDELMRVLDDQVRAGKILYPAVSDWSAWETAEANTIARERGWSPFVATQFRYNLLDRSPDRELLPMAASFDLPIFAWGPLAEGRLTGKYLNGAEGRLSGGAGYQFTKVGSDDIVREVVAIAEEAGWTPAQVAIAWLLHQPSSMIPIIAARTALQFAENLAAVDVRLDDDQLRRLSEVSRVPLGFPGDVMSEQVVIDGVYGRQLPLVDDVRAYMVRAAAH
jgi:aryl-alcohol dehydrogenase-like predicted oxidoreductase